MPCQWLLLCHVTRAALRQTGAPLLVRPPLRTQAPDSMLMLVLLTWLLQGLKQQFQNMKQCSAAAVSVGNRGGCSAEVLQPCLSLLDDVDIAEQSRILCAIQQHQLYTKHCLTSKKRQMTLGDFVAPKRLK